ncbi:sdpI/YhfL family protein [Streptococcus intermedius BA1]|uniref:SdpI family protein n=1 Tax=Streptococcus intermedius TaxID=1338 RepID=UPI00029C68A6|nr:SdpI family protein [Streptococcus intermedius]EKU16427.1 sdpI/YhfL family protein [Streptococcus intermedius BA1]
MENKRFNKLFMVVSFLAFLITYYLTNSQYSSIIGLIYTLLITIQVHNSTKNNLRWLLTLVFAVITVLSIVNSNMIIDTKLSLFLLCSVIIFIGNLCSLIPYNPFIGIRIFSTRNDEGNWKATHNMLADLSIPVSCLILLLSNFLNMNIVVTVSFTIWLILPIIYSIWFYPKKGGINMRTIRRNPNARIFNKSNITDFQFRRNSKIKNCKSTNEIS